MPVPYAHLLEGRDALASAEATTARWPGMLDRETDRVAAAEAPLAAGKWTLRQLMCHLADCEIAWAWRLRQALAEEHTVLQPFDQDAWARSYDAYTMEEARATFFAVRAWNLALLRRLPPEARTRPLTHPERGEETLWDLVRILAGHDVHHQRLLAAQIEARS